MARLRGHRTLDVSRPLYVKRAAWTYGGRAFAKGDAFDWQALGVSPRKLHQLWLQRIVGHEKPHERNGAENPAALVKPFAVEAPKKRARRHAE